MKCSGIIKEKNKQGKIVYRNCNEKLDEHAIFCPRCGKATEALSSELGSIWNFKQTWQEFLPRKSSYLGLGLFLLLVVYIPLGVVVYFTRTDYWLSNLLLLFTVPFSLIPFSFSTEDFKTGFSIGNYFRSLKHYFKYWLFVLINIIYFLIFKILCTGFLLGVATDPILHLVRFIMVLYWITIVSPVPILMIREKINPFKAIKIAYKAGEETRWQQFYILFSILIINVCGLILIIAGMLVSLPLSYYLLERYYNQMKKYRLFKI